jgi:protein involved in polysaccharide export with SLBB domain
MKKFFYLIIVSILPFSFQSICFSQINQSGLTGSGGAAVNYYFAKPGDLTIIVNLWGLVSRPGRYEISKSIDLIHLISLAGGPVQYAKLNKIRITRLIKTDSGVERKEFTVNIKDLTKVKDSELVLYPGDTIFIDNVIWADVKDIIGTASTILVFTTAVIQLINIISQQ